MWRPKCRGLVFAVLVAFGRFLASNIVIHSEYIWFIGALFAIALVAALRLAFITVFSS